MTRLSVLALPVALALWGLQTGSPFVKVCVPLSCAAILAALARRPAAAAGRQTWVIVGSLICSAVGDGLLATRQGRPIFFLGGIAAFFAAHLGYIRFTLGNGRISWLTLGIALAVFLPYFAVALRPALRNPILAVAVLFYLMVSCVTLAASAGLRLPARAKACFLGGITLLVASDTFISLHEFLGYAPVAPLALPAYYASLVLITSTFLLPSPKPPPNTPPALA